MEVEYNAGLKINGSDVDMNYERHESLYAQNNREQSTMKFEFGGKSLYIDFYNMFRTMN
jgi:hypothetical protein